MSTLSSTTFTTYGALRINWDSPYIKKTVVWRNLLLLLFDLIDQLFLASFGAPWRVAFFLFLVVVSRAIFLPPDTPVRHINAVFDLILRRAKAESWACFTGQTHREAPR